MKYIILGAGPAGLTAANFLYRKGEKDFLVLEQEKEAGGLCRSREIGGAPLDIGGGHFLDACRSDVNRFLFSFMPEEEWNLFERDSQINIHGEMIGHPIEANIWQMDVNTQLNYLQSIAKAGCNTGEPMPEAFVDWIYWKLGKRIAEDYMLPYNQKMFCGELNSLGTYWLEKLPKVSFEETLRSCLERKPYGNEPGHAQFYYPKKYGYEELWRRMAEAVSSHIVYGTKAETLEFKESGGVVNGEYSADVIITTVPWTSFQGLIGMSPGLKEKIALLKHSSVQIEYREGFLDTSAHWIYYPDTDLAYHRILVRHNFCPGSTGYWTETNRTRATSDTSGDCFVNEYAYPLNTIGKPEIMKELLDWAADRKVYGLGRWGEWQHYNSDAVVARAMELMGKLMDG